MYADHLRIRPATDEDRDVIARIAALDSSHPIDGSGLIGEIDGIPVAAMSLSTGHVVANPFRPTARLVDLMRVQARRTGGVDARPSPATRLRRAFARPRTAYAG